MSDPLPIAGEPLLGVFRPAERSLRRRHVSALRAAFEVEGYDVMDDELERVALFMGRWLVRTLNLNRYPDLDEAVAELMGEE